VNSLASWTSAVHDFKFTPMRRWEPLPVLMNCRPCQLTRAVSIPELTVVFPLPVAPMRLWRRLVQITVKQTRHIRYSDGRGGLRLLVGRDPIGFTRGHAVVEAERMRGRTMKVYGGDVT
jgi:hypothetical protein